MTYRLLGQKTRNGSALSRPELSDRIGFGRRDVVHVLSEGRVVATGDRGLAEIVDRTGYAAYN